MRVLSDLIQRRRPVSEQPARFAPATLAQFFLDFLSPTVWRQAHQANSRREHKKRWELQPLVTVLLVLSWCQGDSLPERFETARACYVALHPKRRQPGKTVRGFALALRRLPMPVLRSLLAAVRCRLSGWLHSCWRTGGFVLLGCDGSRLECPRTAALERALGCSGKKKKAKKAKKRPKKKAKKGPETKAKEALKAIAEVAPVAAASAPAAPSTAKADEEMSLPSLWLTALVHLASGVPYAWLVGKGDASEQRHLQRLAKLLPACALVITDAGYRGFALLHELLDAKADFLIRLSSATTLYTLEQKTLKKFETGQVAYYWPAEAQKQEQPPVKVRVIRVRGCQKQDVWLLTSVLEESRLSVKDAARYYKMRWGSEGFFRTYKRTLGNLKLRFDTPALVFREVEVALLGAQLLLCQGARAIPAAEGETAPGYSPRKVLQAFRKEVTRLAAPRLLVGFAAALKKARAERRKRTSAKEKRVWPRRKPHTPPKRPKIRTMTDDQKDLLFRCETGP
jgi:Transposase DDE domain